MAFQDIISKINSLKLTEAIAMLRSRKDFNDSSLVGRLNDVERTWKAMLAYQSRGVHDPMFKRSLGNIKEELYFITDNLRRHIVVEKSASQYASYARLDRLQNIPLAQRLTECEKYYEPLQLAIVSGQTPVLEDMTRSEDALNVLYGSVFTMFDPKPDIIERLKNVINDTHANSTMRFQILSALIFGLLQFYDKKRFALLADIALDSDDPGVQSRAMIGLLLVLRKYAARINSDIQTKERLEALKDSPEYYSLLRAAILAIVSTYDTKRISDKLEKEIIPDMMKFRPDLMKKLKEIDPENPEMSLEMNPEWEEMLNKSGLGDRLAEMSELQESGADIMMMPFSKLKSFPFFDKMSNWTLPFSRFNSYLLRSLDSSCDALLKILENNHFICENDKYSLALSLTRLPEAQKAMMKSQMDAQQEMLNANLDSASLISSSPEFDNEARNFVRDLYRFFKLSRFSKEFYDFFTRPFAINDLPVVSEVLSGDDIYRILSEFYFERGFYEEALPMLEKLSQITIEDTALLEKRGYCRQVMSDIPGAIECYERALDLNGNSLWLIKKLAYCYRVTSDYAKAASFYARVSEKEPDNIKAVINEARCRMLAGEFDTASNLYYKALYMDAGNEQALKGIAEVEMVRGNYDKSYEYLIRLTLMFPDAEIYVRAANASMLKNDVAEALRLYGEAYDWLASGEEDKTTALDKLEAMISEYADFMIIRGADKTMLQLVPEIIRNR